MLKQLLALAGVALLQAPAALAAAGGCHAISGSYVNHNVPCTVRALACVVSDVTGDFAGTSTTIITGFSRATGIYTGTVTNVLENGAIVTTTIEGSTVNGVGQSFETITGGTRQFAHATGTIAVGGVNGVGTYTGEYCLGNGGGDDD
jgi:hypothetical protein